MNLVTILFIGRIFLFEEHVYIKTYSPQLLIFEPNIALHLQSWIYQ